MDNAVEFEFVQGNLMLLPYQAGIGVYKDNALVELHDRLKREELWHIVFHEGPGMTLLEFMNFFSTGRNPLQILSIVDGDIVVDVAGMSWLSDFLVCDKVLKKAVGSFVFFRDYQKPFYTDAFGSMILQFWFEKLGLDTLVGVTPEPNRAALSYVKRCGLNEVARVPRLTTYRGEVVTGVVTCLTKDEYRQRLGGQDGKGRC